MRRRAADSAPRRSGNLLAIVQERAAAHAELFRQISLDDEHGLEPVELWR